MAVTSLRRLAATAPVPVFVARGGGAGLLPVELAADPRLRLVTSPRHATVLLAAGRFPGAMGDALNRVHDQLPAPFRTVWWTVQPEPAPPPALRQAAVVTGRSPIEALLDAHRDAILGGRSDGPVLADEPPNPFEGRGDYGQGGEGMMGGVPYGRPMAMTGDDRDGLALDQLRATFGPFLPGFPNGLQVHAVLQGGIVQEARVEVLDLGRGPSLDDEADRARHGVRWLAEALRLGGLHALARRALTGPGASTKLVRRSGLLQAWSGIGVLDGQDARARLERQLDPGTAGGAGRTDLSDEQVGQVLTGQDWSDAVVSLWSLDLPTDRAPTLAS